MISYLVTLLTLLPVASEPGEPRAWQRRSDEYLELAARPETSALQKAAYQELAKLHEVRFTGLIQTPTLRLNFPGYLVNWKRRDEPMGKLYRLGLDVLPTLAEALDDSTPTETPRFPSPWNAAFDEKGREIIRDPLRAAVLGHNATPVNPLVGGPCEDDVATAGNIRIRHDWVMGYPTAPRVPPPALSFSLIREVYPRTDRLNLRTVNSLVAILICCIAGRDFEVDIQSRVIPLWDVCYYPERTADFKRVVLDWYEANKNRAPVERQVADISNKSSANRLAAIRWIGAHKAHGANVAVAQHMKSLLLAKERPSSHDAELAACALTLGQIGDRAALEDVRRACRVLLNRAALYRYGVENYGDTPYDLFDALFTAYQGLALLGEKDKALSELAHLYALHANRMSPSDRAAFSRRFEAAKKNW